ncbi:ABC transporter ATP-binding protein [Blastococcus saxobsidens]|uniref:Putative ABC-type multidrug transport system, ATPase and permease component n=1 Tax=Blastococcus saxobsidens (strain DD2) TaxID=1146883 RepID=H6RMZ1_BLASD|nr:ATP-binding cassette domain-containing protein [Blastococcus saxobsidens]CCG01344.1 putative ABC-type multidrug transport system, ATPase and permease component [Blastococcus saxobsidens DD2]
MRGEPTVGRTAELRRVAGLLGGAVRLAWRADRVTFIAAAGWTVVGAVSLAALVLVGKWVLDGILAAPQGGASAARLAPALAALAVVTALAGAATAFQQQHQRLMNEQTSQTVWRQVLGVTSRVGLEAFESPSFFDRLQRIQDNAVTQPAAVATGLFGLIGGGVGTILLLAALLTLDPLLVPVLLLAGVPSVLLSRKASRTEFEFTTRAMPIYRRRTYLRRVLTGRQEAKEVRAFGVEAALRHRHEQASAQFLSMFRDQARRRQRYAAAVVGTTSLALVLTLALLVWLIAVGRVGLAEAGAAALGVRLVSSRLEQLFKAVGTLIESSTFLADLADFLDSPGQAAQGDEPSGAPLLQDVVLEDVHYTYPETATPALRGVDLTIRRGQVVALVGENGSGKTTVAKIVACLYPPTQGTMRWDGRDIGEMEPARIRRSVAVIFQDFVRYQLTARENIDLSGPDEQSDQPRVEVAAHRAGAAPFIERLPEGYDTLLGKEFAGGVDLSVGQWQRVALARALFRDAPLVVLDEPTAALDPRAEHALFEDVRALLGGRTALLVSHRFSSVRSADMIYVLQDGRVVEQGTHDALMAEAGLYAELFTLQARAYL